MKTPQRNQTGYTVDDFSSNEVKPEQSLTLLNKV